MKALLGVIIGVLIILVVFLVHQVHSSTATSTGKGLIYTTNPVNLPVAAIPSTLRWRYEPFTSPLSDIQYTRVWLDVAYNNGIRQSKLIDEVPGYCNNYKPSEVDPELVSGSTSVQCFAQGSGQWLRIIQRGTSYLIQRKLFEDKLPGYTPPNYQWQTFTKL